MLRIEESPGHRRAFIEGDMTIYTASALKEELVRVLDDPRELELNLAQVSEIDSTGVQLLMLVKREREGTKRSLSLTQHSVAVLDVFELMGLAPYFGDPVVMTRKKGA